MANYEKRLGQLYKQTEDLTKHFFSANKLLERLFPLVQQIDSAILQIYPEIKVYYINEDLRLIKSPDTLKSPLGTDIQIIEGFGIPRNNLYFIIIVLIIILYLFIIL
jgi:hypothetical protein